MNRKLGIKRTQGSREGLTKAQAERELRRLMQSEIAAAPALRMTVAAAAERYLNHLRTLGRKKSTLMDYESALRVHLGPFFGETPLDRIGPEHVEAFVAAKRREGKAQKSILNWLGLLHSVFVFAERRRWARGNPCKLIDKPRSERERRIRFLDQTELEALLRARPKRDSKLWATDRLLYLTAAMTGLRQGELLALRWRDVDWLASRIRVRENYVRGEFGSPKSPRSSRAVPLADRLARELEAHFQRSRFQADDDLVFCHPELGEPLERSRLLKRYKQALKRAELRPVRFHDLRHTFGTRMAAAGVPMRTLQEWMGHRDFATTLIYADYQPGEHEAQLVESAFEPMVRSTSKPRTRRT